MRCSKGFYLQNQTCEMVNPLCKTFDETALECVECYIGYEVVEGTCVVSSSEKALGCAKYEGKTCVKCAKGYYFSNDECVQSNPLCRTFDETNGHCLSCYAGFLLENDVCVKDEG